MQALLSTKYQNIPPNIFLDIEPKKKVLIVEDEKMVRQLLLKRAEKVFDYECRWDDTGGDTLTIAEEFEPDLILLDMYLPSINGLQIISQIRAHQQLKNTPIVVFSAYGNPALVKEAMQEGASIYYTKGGSIVDLFTIVNEFLH